jgi:hypothetical protein
MKLFKIRDWERCFENNRTREMKRLGWVPVPNRHDGDGFRAVIHHEDGLKMFGAWVLILQVASKCKPRGSLIRDNGLPHTAQTIARMTGSEAGDIYIAMEYLATSDVAWLSVEDFASPQEGATATQEDADGPPPPSQAAADSALERKGIEQKGSEQNASTASAINTTQALPSPAPTEGQSRGQFVNTFPALIPPEFGAEFREQWDKFCRHCSEGERGVTKARAGSIMDGFEAWGEDRSVEALKYTIHRGWFSVYEDKGNQRSAQPEHKHDGAEFVTPFNPEWLKGGDDDDS